MTEAHDCPGGCGAPVDRERLACRECWYRLPKDIREAVSYAWAKKDARGHRAALGRALQWYRDHPRPAADQQKRQGSIGPVLFMEPPSAKKEQ